LGKVTHTQQLTCQSQDPETLVLLNETDRIPKISPFESPSNHKYDTTNYFTIDPQFGDLRMLQELVGACHARGLRVILDGVFNMLNLLGSHDTERPMTVVAKHNGGADAHAFESLKLMIAMQFTWAGAPCIFYGDEIGMEGDKDPDCRRCYPWNWEQNDSAGGERALLLAHYKKLIAIRMDNPALRHGRFRKLQADAQFYAFERRTHDNRCIVAINQGDRERTLQLPSLFAADLLWGQPIENDQVSVPAHRAVIVRITALPAQIDL
jgi:glycosidase